MERHVLHVPIRPTPKTVRRHERIRVDVQRRAFLAVLPHDVHGVLGAVVGRESGFEIDAPVVRVRAHAFAAVFERVGHRLIVARHAPRVALVAAHAALHVIALAARARENVPRPTLDAVPAAE